MPFDAPTTSPLLSRLPQPPSPFPFLGTNPVRYHLTTPQNNKTPKGDWSAESHPLPVLSGPIRARPSSPVNIPAFSQSTIKFSRSLLRRPRSRTKIEDLLLLVPVPQRLLPLARRPIDHALVVVVAAADARAAAPAMRAARASPCSSSSPSSAASGAGGRDGVVEDGLEGILSVRARTCC